ncbi:MAG: LacI family transcriptional regulator [Victivallaceae bacterium]|nr:LacI family transcriptional regulator [Victivallaceae bacterium]
MNIALKERYNVHDVAKAAGVSAMTITRVFNNSARVAPATKAKVLDAAGKLNYRPSRSARTLRQGRSHSIGLLWSLGGPHDSTDVVRKMTHVLSEAGYVSYLTDTMSERKIINNCLIDLIERKVDGLIIQAPDHDPTLTEYISLLNEIGSVVVVSPNLPDEDMPFDYLHRDLMYGIDKSLSYLYETGRRNILVLATQGKKLVEIEEMFAQQPYINFLSYGHIETGKQQIDYHLFAEKVKLHLDQGKRCDAVWCSCDEGAAAVITLLQDRGMRVPEDIAVSGVNDTPICQYIRPGIASIDRKNSEVAAIAASMLLKRIANPELPLQRETVNMRFVKRKSAGGE